MITASICIVALNEEDFLQNLLNDILDQDYPHNEIEVLLIDSMSTDTTLDIMNSFKETSTDFHDVKVLRNERKIQAAGWNVALMNVSGKVIFRIDAHTHIPKNFVSLNIKNIENGEFVSGGIRPCIIENSKPWNDMLLQAENSIFGSGINISRRGDRKQYVKTMFHAAYRRDVFAEIGGFNENLLRTEDNEIHNRIRKAGYRLCFDPSIISYQFARNSLRKMIKQKFGNGYWVGLTLGVSKESISFYHLVPAIFVIAIIVTLSLSWFWSPFPAIALCSAYFAFCTVSVIFSFKNRGMNLFFLLMPLAFLILHISYGIGTLKGIVEIPQRHSHLMECTEIEKIKERFKDGDKEKDWIS